MISKIFAEEETENKKPNTDPLMEKFLKTRQIIVSGEVNAELVERIVKQLLILEAESDKPIYLYIDSPGGSVDDGFGLYDVIRFIKAPVYTIGMGLIASMGVTLFLSVPKERRFSLPNSHFLIHQPLGGSKGVATDIEITANEISKTREYLTNLIAEATGKDFETVKKDTERDYWLTAQEAVDYGIVGKIITNRSELN
ncbi:MAG: ATP-dependent Clp protease proteolytic subunit [Treponema sp.]|nr:ATP-dependent Clp protease proteolytic subunit [Treponema sp.]MBP3607535.1 ATP-dependent Clp protease proteolytic subunit [Treponema sp.]MBQ7882538.1 ATP-dependent Clp protease proteolytic subunit [Treponema sp.]